MPRERGRKNNCTLCIVLPLTHVHISFASAPTLLLPAKAIPGRACTHSWTRIALGFTSLPRIAATLGSFNESWDGDFSPTPFSLAQRSGPQGTSLILHTQQWPYSPTRAAVLQTLRLEAESQKTAGSISMLYGLIYFQKAARWKTKGRSPPNRGSYHKNSSDTNMPACLYEREIRAEQRLIN